MRQVGEVVVSRSLNHLLLVFMHMCVCVCEYMQKGERSKCVHCFLVCTELLFDISNISMTITIDSKYVKYVNCLSV